MMGSIQLYLTSYGTIACIFLFLISERKPDRGKVPRDRGRSRRQVSNNETSIYVFAAIDVRTGV